MGKYKFSQEISAKELNEIIEERGLKPSKELREVVFEYMKVTSRMAFENRDVDWKYVEEDLREREIEFEGTERLVASMWGE